MPVIASVYEDKEFIKDYPDLLKNKKVGQGSIEENNAISDQDFIDIAIENNSIKTDIIFRDRTRKETAIICIDVASVCRNNNVLGSVF